MSTLIFFIALFILVVGHEFGHFFFAKKAGIRIDEFAFGFPPRLWSVVKGETRYSFNLLPLGGFVKIYGEEGGASADTRHFGAQKTRVKLLVLAGGILANIILAWFFFSASYMAGVLIPSADNAIFVTDVLPGGAAETILLPGDRIVHINNVPIDSLATLSAQTQTDRVLVGIQRGETDTEVLISPQEGLLGISVASGEEKRLPVHTAVLRGAQTTYTVGIGTVTAIAQLLKDAVTGNGSLDGLAGPVGIAKTTGAAASFGFGYLLSFIGLLSINLAVINLVPFPALDGGRIVIVLIERIIGRPLPAQFTGWYHTLGFILLMGLMLLITYNDIFR